MKECQDGRFSTPRRPGRGNSSVVRANNRLSRQGDSKLVVIKLGIIFPRIPEIMYTQEKEKKKMALEREGDREPGGGNKRNTKFPQWLFFPTAPGARCRCDAGPPGPCVEGTVRGGPVRTAARVAAPGRVTCDGGHLRARLKYYRPMLRCEPFCVSSTHCTRPSSEADFGYGQLRYNQTLTPSRL